jgi:ABC-type phosphate/phosphonate transport system substrate-binding protein
MMSHIMFDAWRERAQKVTIKEKISPERNTEAGNRALARKHVMTCHCRTAAIVIASLFLALCISDLSGLQPVSDAAASGTYRFGVVPQFPQRRLYAVWQPVLRELEKRTGLSFELVTTLTIQEFEKEFARGEFDFVYMNPYYMLKVMNPRGYLPLVRDKTPLRGILVVRKDSGIREISQLNGKLVAFPSPNAIGASLLIRAELERLHHIKVRPLYVKTHSSVYLHVVQGLVAAGGGVEKTLREQNQTVRDSLRIIYTTRRVPSHPVAAHPRVSRKDREKVREALLAMGNTPAGREMLSKIPVKRFIPASMADYQGMRSWGLEDYWETPRGKE